MNYLLKKKNIQVIVAQTGARRHYAVPVALNQAGILNKLYTDAYSGPGSWLHQVMRIIPEKYYHDGLARFSGRGADLPPEKIKAFNCLWVGFFLANRRKQLKQTLQDYILISKLFNKFIIKEISSDVNAAYGYDKASLELFRWAKDRGIKCILDQSTTPWDVTRVLYKNVSNKFPDWDDDPDLDCRTPLAERERQEWKLADLILCPSHFVFDAFKQIGVPEGKLAIVPYGKDLNYWQGSERIFEKDQSLRLLFVGPCTLFKGFPFLLEALCKLQRNSVSKEEVILNCVGKPVQKDYALLKNVSSVNYIGFIPYSRVKHYYDIAHVFVLPSISEGSASVTHEALASGLPVITTLNSGSIVRDGIEGFIVPPGDSKAIADRIKIFLDNPELVRHMSQNALKRAKEFSSENYGKMLVNAITTLY